MKTDNRERCPHGTKDECCACEPLARMQTPETAPLSGEDAAAAGDVASASNRNCTETSGSERSRSGVSDFAATPPVIAPGEEREAIARTVYDAMRIAADLSCTDKHPTWVAGGNSLMQDEARRTADAILALAQPRQTDETVKRDAWILTCIRDMLRRYDGKGPYLDRHHGLRHDRTTALIGDIRAALATPADDGEQRG